MRNRAVTEVCIAQQCCGFQGLYLQTLSAERVEGQGYFAYGVGGCEFESHPVHRLGADSVLAAGQ